MVDVASCADPVVAQAGESSMVPTLVGALVGGMISAAIAFGVAWHGRVASKNLAKQQGQDALDQARTLAREADTGSARSAIFLDLLPVVDGSALSTKQDAARRAERFAWLVGGDDAVEAARLRHAVDRVERLRPHHGSANPGLGMTREQVDAEWEVATAELEHVKDVFWTNTADRMKGVPPSKVLGPDPWAAEQEHALDG